MPRLLKNLLTLTFFLSLPAFSQEPPAISDNTPATPETPDPAVSKDILAIRLSPLDKEELASRAAAWQSLLEVKSKEIAALEIAILQKDGDLPAARASLATLRDEKAALVARTGIVLDAYELKGGEAGDLRKYLAAVDGIQSGATDFASRFHAVPVWLASDEGGMKWLYNSLKFIGIIFIFWVIAIFASKIIHRAIEKQPHISSLLKVFLNKMTRRLILVVGFIVALGTVGVNVGAALALIGGGAFILAFALQDTLSNFASGIMLIVYRPFDVGDAVEIGGIAGSVDSVSLVSTTIRTFDNKKVLVPNKKVWGEVITNITGMPTRRVDMTFGIGYNDDADKAQEILENIVREHELTLEIPEPAIHLNELADSSVNFICRPWAKTEDHWTVYWDITKRVKNDFAAAGISIPFPQRDVHLYREISPRPPQ